MKHGRSGRGSRIDGMHVETSKLSSVCMAGAVTVLDRRHGRGHADAANNGQGARENGAVPTGQEEEGIRAAQRVHLHSPHQPRRPEAGHTHTHTHTQLLGEHYTCVCLHIYYTHTHTASLY